MPKIPPRQRSPFPGGSKTSAADDRPPPERTGNVHQARGPPGTTKPKWRAKAEQAVELPPELAAHRVLTTRQAAELVGYDEVHWRKLHRQGLTPPAIELSSSRLGWLVGDLVAWLESKKTLRPRASEDAELCA